MTVASDSFPIDFICEKPANKVTNHDYVAAGVLQWLKFQGPVVSTTYLNGR